MIGRIGKHGNRRSLGLGGRRNERGAEMLETALALPLLLAIILGFYAFGRGWDIYQTMTRAAREGVRQAVTTSCATCGNSSYTTAQVQSKFVFPALQAAGINTSQVQSYTQGYTWLDASDKVCGAYISFQYPYQLVIPFLPASDAQIMLKTDVQMRLENPPNTGTCP